MLFADALLKVKLVMIITKVGYDCVQNQYADLRSNICLYENALYIQFYPALREEWGEERALLYQKVISLENSHIPGRYLLTILDWNVKPTQLKLTHSTLVEKSISLLISLSLSGVIFYEY